MRKPPEPRVEPDACFLNIPYDKSFENLYLAYIIGLTAKSSNFVNRRAAAQHLLDQP